MSSCKIPSSEPLQGNQRGALRLAEQRQGNQQLECVQYYLEVLYLL